jgi:hypothetical protein
MHQNISPYRASQTASEDVSGFPYAPGINKTMGLTSLLDLMAAAVIRKSMLAQQRTVQSALEGVWTTSSSTFIFIRSLQAQELLTVKKLHSYTTPCALKVASELHVKA